MNKKLTFEQADAKLDEVVAKLENSQLPLKESVDCYTEACELLAFCMQELSESKGKIEDINTKLNNICTTDGEIGRAHV